VHVRWITFSKQNCYLADERRALQEPNRPAAISPSLTRRANRESDIIAQIAQPAP